jgi:polar amino acid transport system substrate-binding protein
MRLSSLLCCLLLITSITVSAAEVRLATLEYPPYSSVSLPERGSIVELTTRAFAATGNSVQIDFLPWARALAELRKGNYDGILLLWPEEIVNEQLIPSRPLLYSELGFFIRKDTPVVFTDLSQLTGRKVGVARGYGYPKDILNSGIVSEEGTDDLSNLRKLAAGRFDLVLLEQQVGLHLLSREPTLQKNLAWQGQILARIPLFVGFAPPKPGQRDWASVYAQGLSALFANGDYLRILQKHSQTIP